MPPRKQLNIRLTEADHENLNRIQEKAQQVLGAPGLSQADVLSMGLKQLDAYLDFLLQQKDAHLSKGRK